MRNRSIATNTLLAALALSTGVAAAPTATAERTMTMQARGPFDVKVAPVETQPYEGGTTLGRYALEKQLHGDLVGASKGEMLTAGTAVQGSAGYVAIERVTGALAGRKGTFVLAHRGTMSGGSQQLDIAVVPDSGTGELAGLAGTMRIRIEADGKHFYELDYTLPER